jgi:hypothetical protein
MHFRIWDLQTACKSVRVTKNPFHVLWKIIKVTDTKQDRWHIGRLLKMPSASRLT